MLKKIIIVLLFINSISCTQQSEEQSLKVGISADYPPFEYNENNEVIGFDVDLIKEIGLALNKKILIQEMPWESLIPALQSHHIDMAISSITSNPIREKSVAFSKNYYEPKFALITQKKLKSIDLNGMVIGVQTGSIMEILARKLALELDLKINSLSNNIQIIEELKLGRLDGVIIEEVQAKAFCLKNKELNYKIIDAKVYLGNKLEGYAIAFPKDSKIIPEVNNIIDSLSKSGKLDFLINKWINK